MPIMSPLRKKTETPVAMSPLRAKLAEAIEHLAERREFVQVHQRAEANARMAKDAALRAVVTAEAAIKAAPEALREFMIASARGENVERPKSIKECRADLEDAQAEFQAAIEAFKMMESEAAKHSDVSWAESKVQVLAARVVQEAPATAMLLSEAYELRRQLNERWQILSWIATKAWEDGKPSDMARAMDRLNRPVSVYDAADGYQDVSRTGKLDPWAKAFDALIEDAAAPLPNWD